MADVSTITLSLLILPCCFAMAWLIKMMLYLVKLLKINHAVAKFATVDYHWFYGHMKYIKAPPMNEEAMMKILDLANRSEAGAAALMFPLLSNLLVCLPETFRKVVNMNPPKGGKPASGEGYHFFRPWLGDSLVMSKGEKWSRDRKLVDPAFHQSNLRSYLTVFNSCTRELINSITQEMNNNEGKGDTAKSINISPLVNVCTLNIVVRSIFSITEENVQKRGSDPFFIDSITDICTLLLQRIYEPYMWMDSIYFRLSEGKRFIDRTNASREQANIFIQKRKETLRNEKLECTNSENTKVRKNLDFLDILLLARDDNGHGFSEEELADHVQAFIFGGYDTTSSAISWILYNLARHPEIQRQAREEVDQVLGEGDTDVEWEHLHQMNYLTRCVKESLRLHPPVTNVRRELLEPLTIAGKDIPAGAVVDLAIYCLHHNPRVWGENHMEYIPDRFLPENIADMDPCSFIPFSFGSRNCIGQNFAMHELKAAVALILHKFELKLDESHPVKMISELVLRAEHGIKLFFTKVIK